VSVTIEVLKVNPRARALYERLGFEVTGETPMHLQMRTGSR
jgi:ribosomal protein S18 acetylase RimI-like enzyme